MLLRRMHWLQTEEDGTYNLQSLQLDIVGFLAILGEGSVLANAQVSTLSKIIFLPRLIPAPQALMRPTRPVDLEPVRGDVSAVWAGNDRGHVNHIGNIICDANNLPPFSVRVVTIERNNENPIKAKPFGPLTYVALLGFSLSAMLLGLSIHLHDGMSIIATILLSLLSSLIGLGNYWTLKLPKRKTKDDDGPAVQELGSWKWALWFSKRGNTSTVDADDSKGNASCNIDTAETGTAEAQEDLVPPGDVVIRYPKGNFLIVRCHENVARELYFAPEEIAYLIEDAWVYRLLSLIGTMMLMGGVICLANARIESQIAWAGSYMLLGSAYWIVAALPGKVHWDTSCYTVTSEALSDSKLYTKGHMFSRIKKEYPYSPSDNFTQALWKAIVASKDETWVRRHDHCPNTNVWAKWLHMARTCSREFMDPMTAEEKQGAMANQEKKNADGITTWEIPKWDPSGYFQYLLKEEKDEREKKAKEAREFKSGLRRGSAFAYDNANLDQPSTTPPQPATTTAHDTRPDHD